ncbi:SAM-dependent methyltransferase [Psychrobacter sp. 1U2]|uniref:SAM-dependent methyltransferase n=1 Tax=Psychrobacter sp. 1U2 TaxID=3453577 RepID=UPI003F4545AC
MPEILADEQKIQRSLVIEIGAGKGMHALSFAKQNPDKHLIAIERTRNKFDAFFKMTQTQQLSNLTAVHADAIAWIVQALAPHSLTQIYLLYPNPEQHNPNQQWLNMPFFEFLLSRLQTGGEIVLATNIEPYIDNAEEQAGTLWCLPTIRQEVPIDSQRTHFEIKYLARKETCWQLTMTKPEGYQTRFDAWQAN